MTHEKARRGSNEGLFLRLAGNNLRVDNTRNPCNLAAILTPPAIECVAWFSYTLALRENVQPGIRGSGVSPDNRRHHPYLLRSSPPSVSSSKPDRCNIHARLSFCNLRRLPPVHFPSNLINVPFTCSWATYTLGSFVGRGVRNTIFAPYYREIVRIILYYILHSLDCRYDIRSKSKNFVYLIVSLQPRASFILLDEVIITYNPLKKL